MTGGADETQFGPLPTEGAVELPPEPSTHVGPGPDQRAYARSLMADLEATIEDGKVYLEAEAAYQKTRAVYIVDRIRAVAFYALIGAGFGFISLIALTVGAILTLDNLMPTSLASAIVVGIEALLALYFLHRASRRWSKIIDAFGMDERRVEKEGEGAKE